jgi:hypothetical protein
LSPSSGAYPPLQTPRSRTACPVSGPKLDPRLRLEAAILSRDFDMIAAGGAATVRVLSAPVEPMRTREIHAEVETVGPEDDVSP